MSKYTNKTNLTKKHIEQALLNLLTKETMNRISMSLIAQEANVNRVTLYRHFDDKWDILEKIENDFLEQLIEPHYQMRVRLQNPTSSFSNVQLYELTQFLEVFHQNIELLRILMNNEMDRNFTNKMLRFLIKLEQLSHPYLDLNISNIDKELFSYYTISSLIGVIQYWTKHSHYSSETMARFFFKMRINSVKGLSDN